MNDVTFGRNGLYGEARKAEPLTYYVLPAESNVYECLIPNRKEQNLQLPDAFLGLFIGKHVLVAGACVCAALRCWSLQFPRSSSCIQELLTLCMAGASCAH